MKILGISAFYHDSAAALLVGGQIVAAAQEERFTRKKNTAVFPVNAIRYCLAEAGMGINDLDAIVFYDKPFLKFERLIETYYAFAPLGLRSFVKAIPVWLEEKLFLKRAIKKGLKQVGKYNKHKLKLLFTEHHLSHAGSAFYVSPFKEAAILTIDGVGEWCTASLGYGNQRSITFLKEMNFPHSVGLLYSAFTYYLGFTVNSGEYKLMGLAPYGNAESETVKKFKERITTKLIHSYSDGSIWLNQDYFNYATGLRMVKHAKWEKLFGFKKRNENEELQQHHCDLASAIQQVTEEIVIRMAVELKRLTNSKNLCMAGGVALNCVSNAKLRSLGVFENIFVQPAAGDAGGALGAALAANYIYFEQDRRAAKLDGMKGAYLGPAYDEKDIAALENTFGAKGTRFTEFEKLAQFTAARLAEGKVVGWFQGRMEFGPRALGNRSILADARLPEMQKKLNLNIKNREGFRPFAPSVLEEYTSSYFESSESSPYMLFVSKLLPVFRKSLPQDFEKMGLWKKLYCDRSFLPAITHLDYSARVQTVSKTTNPEFWQLIESFRQLTGTPMLVNTSFNVRGEPLVCSPEDAYRCFMETEMDLLVINNFVFMKAEQKKENDRERWKRHFEKD